MVRGRLRFDASRKDRSMPDKKFEFYEVFSTPTAFDTFLLHSVLDCASQRPEDAPETANTQNKKEITMDFKKLYFTLFNTLSDAVEQIDTHDYAEARLVLIHPPLDAVMCNHPSEHATMQRPGPTHSGAARPAFLTGITRAGGSFQTRRPRPRCSCRENRAARARQRRRSCCRRGCRPRP